MSDLTPKGFSNGQYVDRYLLRDKLYAEDAITMGGVAILNNFPAADVVEVVQCRECRHAAPNGLDIKCNKHSGSTKSKLGGEISYIELHKPHFFCADGKRMGGGQDDV